jgi:hypothetical protein
MIDFPANPTIGQQFTAVGITWVWDGTKWTFGIVSSIDANVQDITYFGDGSDGAATITTGVALTRDMYYTNLTISGAGVLTCNACRVFVSGILDISAAGAGAIIGATQTQAPNNNGSAALVGGSITVSSTVAGLYATTSGNATGGNGATGGTTGNGLAGGNSVPAPTGSLLLGGAGGNGGVGGNGSGAQTGGNGGIGGGSSINYATNRIRTLTISFIAVNYLLWSSAGGGGGGGGGGSTSTTGGGGGPGGANGASVFIFARTINRGAATAQGAIYTAGGRGGNGGPQTAGVGGAGGGGGGGGGGLVYLVYRFLTGTPATNVINASGGPGGNSQGTTLPGVGGTGGANGLVVFGDLAAGTLMTLSSVSGSAPTGVNGGAGAPCQVTL